MKGQKKTSINKRETFKSFMLSLKDGEYLVQLARRSIRFYLQEGKKAEPDAPPHLMKRMGVFVTLETFPEKRLRGCIGFPKPVMELPRGVIEAAISAATTDPRFPRLRINELDSIIIEVTVLTPPQLIRVEDPRNYPSQIKVGRDGLIVEFGWNSGLLLPQVPVEQGWNESEFLSQTCWKAGLPPDTWLSEGVKIYKFQGQIFSETKPNGKIVEKRLG